MSPVKSACTLPTLDYVLIPRTPLPDFFDARGPLEAMTFHKLFTFRLVSTFLICLRAFRCVAAVTMVLKCPFRFLSRSSPVNSLNCIAIAQFPVAPLGFSLLASP